MTLTNKKSPESSLLLDFVCAQNCCLGILGIERPLKRSQHNSPKQHQFPSTKAFAAINSMSRQNLIPGKSDYDQDDVLISKILNGVEEGEPLDFENIGDTVGKLPNAVDYEDISDDDLLPDEESPSLSGTSQDVDETSGENLANFMNEGEEGTEGNGLDGGLDYLFGDSELIDDTMISETGTLGIGLSAGDLHNGSPSSTRTTADEEMFASSPDTVSSVGADVEILEQVRPKQLTQEDLAKQYFPDFSPHKTLSFISLFKSKPTTLATPHFERPKVCVPRKPKFEMAADDQGRFLKAFCEVSRRNGVIIIRREVEDIEVDAKENIENESSDIKFERDLILACEDWDSKVDAMMTTPPPSPRQKRAYSEETEEVGTHYSRSEKVSSRNTTLCGPQLKPMVYSASNPQTILSIISQTRGWTKMPSSMVT